MQHSCWNQNSKPFFFFEKSINFKTIPRPKSPDKEKYSPLEEFYNDDEEPFDSSSENIVVQDKVKKIRQKVKEHPCLKCDEIFPSRRKMREHILTNHAGDGLKDVRCNLCGKNFYDSSGLKIHLGMISHKMSLIITIFSHQHFRQKIHQKFDIFHEKFQQPWYQIANFEVKIT